MKETLYTIPLTDAFHEADECPFCYISRKLEQDSLDFILGSSSAYMQSDIREKTNKYGFCSMHYKNMFHYGNSLGNALMLQSYIKELQTDLHKKFKSPGPSKPSLLHKLKKETPKSSQTSVGSFCKSKVSSCFICHQIEEAFERYLDTFFFLIRSNEEFYHIFQESKGFCLHHFGILAEAAPSKLNSQQLEDFHCILYPQMEQALQRLETDISWFIDKFDYRNKDADWKSSKDAVPRCMQKVSTGYPADSFYRANR